MPTFPVLAPPLPTSADKTLHWSTPPGSGTALALSALGRTTPLLVVTSSTASAQSLEQDLAFFSDIPVLHFPDWEILPYDTFSPHQDIVSERLLTLSRLHDGIHGIVVVPINTLMQRLPPVDYIAGRVMNLQSGMTLDREGFRAALSRAGYRSVDTVYEPGEYALRGAIIDLYPMGTQAPIRIDLFDDEIETLRFFDPGSQRTTQKTDRLELLPAQEYPLNRSAIACFREKFETLFDVDPRQCPLYNDALKGIASPGLEHYLALFFEETASLFDHLPDTTRVVLMPGVHDAAEHHWQAIESRHANLAVDATRPLLPPRHAFIPVNDLFADINQHPRVQISDTPDPRHAHLVEASSLPELAINAKSRTPLASLDAYLKQIPETRVLFVAESAGRREVLEDILAPLALKPVQVSGFQAFMAQQDAVSITQGSLQQGIKLDNPNMALITETELFGQVVRQHRRREKVTENSDFAIRHLSELKEGAPVVHQSHGVGRYLGLETLEAGGLAHEFVALEYADGAKLFVPVDNLHIISRYSGADDDMAPLHRLGSDQWEKARRKAAEKIRDTAAELLDTYARREAEQGVVHDVPDDEYRRFAASFTFEETPDQQAAIDAVISDMTAPQPMDRVVCGDVGFGKTEVAMRAAFIAVQSGQQVVVLVPTTLLARQHYENFRDRFADTAVNIGLISRFTQGKGASKALDQVRSGQTDIVIGTHKLLSERIELPKMGLLIIDEEHRFGVNQKEKLKALRSRIDILTLTATPIPRTLNMAMSGIRDLSIIATPPARRLSVKTFVQQRDDSTIKEALLRETLRGGQVYFLHNDVKTIENAAERVRELVPEARVATAHGQLPERRLEGVMSDFYHRRYNVLVCSTIIETGIDIPNANTIIIERADKFGLAQLHQLRGRVGRSHHQAYAYLLTPPPRQMTRDALKRLEAISASDDLGAGFTLASHDMEIRGAGELLGDEQSGQMETIGYTLYMEMLDRAVDAIRAGKTPNIDQPFNTGVEINLNLAALIPADYIQDVQQRLVMYKRIAGTESQDALRELQVEMIDRFGLLPDSVKNLIRQTRLRQRAEQLGIQRLEASESRGRIVFRSDTSVDPMTLVGLIQKDPAQYRLEGADILRFELPMQTHDTRFEALERLLGVLNQKRQAA